MHLLVCHNALPVVVAVLVILISWYLWRRTFKAPSSNSGEEQTDSGREKIQSLAAEQKVSDQSQHSSFFLSAFLFLWQGIKIVDVLALSCYFFVPYFGKIQRSVNNQRNG